MSVERQTQRRMCTRGLLVVLCVFMGSEQTDPPKALANTNFVHMGLSIDPCK